MAELTHPIGATAPPAPPALRRLGVPVGDLLRETLADLRQNRLRSVLTMLGIAWGVASLILLTAVGEGMRLAQMTRMDNFGKQIIIVWGGATSLPGPGIRPGKPVWLTIEDYDHLRQQAHHLLRLSPELERHDLVSASEFNQGTFNVSGVLPDYMDMRSIETAIGRRLNEGDVTAAARVCVIGPEVNRQLFAGRATPGAPLRIGGRPYRVVGVMPDKDQNGNYSGNDNSKIFVPYPVMRRDFPLPWGVFGDRQLTNLIAQPRPADDGGAKAEAQLRTLLAARKRFDPLDRDALPIWNTALGQKFMRQIFDSMKLFLGFVAVVTLMLGGLGVMNIMLVSVRERTREIGLRKAVGASRGAIMALFFLEALVISLVSGLAGLFAALGVCAAVNRLPLPEAVFAGMVVSQPVGLAALGFLVFVALAAAFYPACHAAQLDPVDALRFEE